MANRVVKLDDLIPADIRFEMPDGSAYTAPGDPPLATVLMLTDLFLRARSANDGDPGGVGLDLLRQLDEQVLALLRMRQPELKESPFGLVASLHVVGELLAGYGVGVAEPARLASKAKKAAAHG